MNLKELFNEERVSSDSAHMKPTLCPSPVQEVSRKLKGASNKSRSWKDKVAKHEGLVRLIQPGKGGGGVLNSPNLNFMEVFLFYNCLSIWQ